MSAPVIHEINLPLASAEKARDTSSTFRSFYVAFPQQTAATQSVFRRRTNIS